MRLTALLLMLFLPFAAAAQDRVAMVIGISAYEDAATLDGRVDPGLAAERLRSNKRYPTLPFRPKRRTLP